ncbi:helix-turn-helix domain-containing protein [Fimbriiglobus ruber]|uniref:helix-turn-helix domain-containing protein n=1 Tax=Fimbriiglobus ruber TaxID=1908690 RepID=UPI000B4AF6B7|nr:helix-turn-helix domain-containing protein [Fimbriiglobus ruber]
MSAKQEYSRVIGADSSAKIMTPKGDTDENTERQKQLPTYLTVAQLAACWRVSRSIIYALVSGGQLPSIRVGLGRGTIRILEAAADAYLKKNSRDDEQTFAEHFS